MILFVISDSRNRSWYNAKVWSQATNVSDLLMWTHTRVIRYSAARAIVYAETLFQAETTSS
jgi:hypothetical protein